MPSFGDIVERSLALLQRRGRVSHTALRLEFGLDDETFAALREELVAVLAAADDDGRVLVARGPAAPGPAAPVAEPPVALAPPDARAAVIPDPTPAARRISVLLCDLAESPPRDALAAEDRAVVGARFHAICADVAGRLGGHVLPWVSDGVAIFFGHPVAQDDDATRAVRCGWEILRALAATSDVVEREFGVRLDARLAIATGASGADPDGAEPFGDVPRIAGAVQADGAPDRVTVDETTRSLADTAFEFEPAAAPGRFALTGPTGSDALGPHAAPPLVGRTGERALLQALAERTVGGLRSAVLVRGEAGIGKTRLLEQLGASAGDDLGMAVMHCACSPYHRGSALYPLLAGLRRHWELDGSDASARLADRAAGLAGGERALALLAGLLGVALPDGAGAALHLGPARRRRESLAALADALVAEAGRAPLLLVVDDLHWADASTLELIATLLDGPRELALMLALTARSEFAGLPQRTLQRIELGRLDAQESRRLVEHVASCGDAARRRGRRAGAAGRRLAAARRRAHAHRARHAGRRAARRHDALRLPDGAAGPRLGRPRRRPARRDDRARVRPHAARRRGHDRRGRHSTGAWSGSSPRTSSCRPVPAASRSATRCCRTPRAARSESARCAATTCASPARCSSSSRTSPRRSRSGSRATSSTPARCARRLATGSRPDARRSATTRCARPRLHFERALELNARTPDGPDRRATELELRVLAGNAIAAHAGRRAPAALAHHARAERLSAERRGVRGALRRPAAPDGLPRARRAPGGRAARSRSPCSRSPRRRAPIRRCCPRPSARSAARSSPADAIATRSGISRARSSSAPAHGAATAPSASAATRRRSRSPTAPSRSRAATITRARAMPSPPRAELLRDRPHPQSAAAVECAAATAAHIRGDHDDARTAAAAAIATATAEDLRELLAQARALHGWADVRAGAHDDGLGELHRAVAHWKATGAAGGGPFVHGLLADALAHTGEPAAGITAIDAGLRWVDGGERWYEPELHRMRAELLLRIGDLSGAHRSAGAAASLARRMRAGAWQRRAAATMARLGSASPVA